MLRWFIVFFLVATSGCAALGQPQAALPNPLPVGPANPDVLWDQVVDVVDTYFTIDREERVRLQGDLLTVGRIDTFPQSGATLLEPWRRDAATLYERWLGTLQTLRRTALVQVIPNENGYLLDVAVFKELEDLRRPENSTAGAATLRNDDSLVHFSEPIGEQPINVGWIPLGRDAALEQRILQQVTQRLSSCGPGLGPPGFSPGPPGQPFKWPWQRCPNP